MIDDLSIMYNTCFMYKNIWDPFFALKNKYCSNLKIKTYLCSDGNIDEYFKDKKLYDNTEFINYPSEARADGFESNYTQRLLYYLINIPTNYVIYWYDDMFLTNHVNFEKINESFELMKTDSNIKTIKLSTCSHPFTGSIYYQNKDFKLQQNSKKDQYCVNLQPSIFRKDFLINMCEYLISNNTIHNGSYDIENYGTKYFHINQDNKSLRSNIDLIPVYGDCGIVSAGYIRNGVLDFLKGENISMKIHDNFIYEKNNENVKKLSDNNINYLKCMKLI